VGAIVRELRQKLAQHKIALVTLHGFGFELGQKDREKIVALIRPRAITETAVEKSRPTDGEEPRKRQNASAAA
jgi:hypothetical protein